MLLSPIPEIYEEVETRRMNAAFDAAWDFIEESDGMLSSPERSDGTRERLALAVVKLVRAAQPTVESLRNAALIELGFVMVDVVCPINRAAAAQIR